MATKPGAEIDYTIAETFSKHWSITSLLNEDFSYSDALDYLSQPEVLDYLDRQSKKLEKIYSRMPKHILALELSGRLRNAATATETSAVVNAFARYMDTSPPPSDTTFLDRLANELKEHRKI